MQFFSLRFTVASNNFFNIFRKINKATLNKRAFSIPTSIVNFTCSVLDGLRSYDVAVLQQMKERLVIRILSLNFHHPFRLNESVTYQQQTVKSCLFSRCTKTLLSYVLARRGVCEVRLQDAQKSTIFFFFQGPAYFAKILSLIEVATKLTSWQKVSRSFSQKSTTK